MPAFALESMRMSQVHESTYGKGDEKIAKKHGHSTNMQAAEVAREAGAKRLL